MRRQDCEGCKAGDCRRLEHLRDKYGKPIYELGETEGGDE